MIPLETWPLFADASGDAKLAEFPDLLHPNEAGYAKWAAALRPVLATLGFLETDRRSVHARGRASRASSTARTSRAGAIAPRRRRTRRAPRAGRPSDTNAAGLADRHRGRCASTGSARAPTGASRRSAAGSWSRRRPSTARSSSSGRRASSPRTSCCKLEFRATPNADSGVYLRGPQLQCRDYALAGPYKNLKGYKPQDWNELVVTVRGGVARATCNGELLEGEMKLPATGPIGLEGDRGQMEYRRIRIQRLPRN